MAHLQPQLSTSRDLLPVSLCCSLRLRRALSLPQQSSRGSTERTPRTPRWRQLVSTRTRLGPPGWKQDPRSRVWAQGRIGRLGSCGAACLSLKALHCDLTRVSPDPLLRVLRRPTLLCSGHRRWAVVGRVRTAGQRAFGLGNALPRDSLLPAKE